jgi:DNA repair exonuclease SbcCD nuclease subunit
MVRFLHTGDWQLGMTRRFLADEAQARFGAARLDAIRSIGRIAAERDCAFVVCAGDVFESNALDRQVVLRALEAMGELDVPLYLLPGNHDPLDAASVYTSPAFTRSCPDNVVVLDGTQVHRPVPGVELHGAPWTSKRPLTDLVATVCEPFAPDEDVLRIIVAHGAVDVGAPDPDDPALIGLAAVERAIDEGCLHYLALGDRHSLTDVGRTGRVRYAGAPEPTDFDEVDPGKVLVVDLEPDGCRAEPVEVATWRFVKEIRDLNGPADVEALAAWLAEQPAKDRTIVRLGLVGTLPLRDGARLDEVLDDARDRYASVEKWERDSDLVVLPDEEDFSDLDLAGFASDTLAELRTMAEGPSAEADAARGALALLYRLSGTGSAR